MLVGILKRAPWAENAYHDYKLGDPNIGVFTSAICQGELLGLAEKNLWGDKRYTELKRLLKIMTILWINNLDILVAYSKINAWTHKKKDYSDQNIRPLKIAVPMNQNDMWIAATAHVIQATLLTADKDFVHLHNIWDDIQYIQQY